MKNLKLYLSLFFLVAMVAAGCSKKSNNPAGPDLGSGNPQNPNNGASAQVEIIIDGVKYNANAGGSYFVPSENLTYTAFWGASNNDSLTVTVVFPGQELSTHSWGLDNSGVYMVKGTGSNIKAYVSDNNGGATIITQYGNVNQNIEGTFSGFLYDVQSGDSIEVFSSFLVKRMPDQE